MRLRYLVFVLPLLFISSARAQDRVGPVAPHQNWSNTLKPRGVPGPSITLASGGKAIYTILLSNKPTGQDKKAAQDLAKWLKLMTGADFQTVTESPSLPEAKYISIGHTALLTKADPAEAKAELRYDGYGVAVRDGNLFLFGGSARGAISAVYALLEEDIGCRWFDWNEANAVIPHIPELSFQPVPRTYRPQFDEMRWILVWESKDVNMALWNRSMDCDQYRNFPQEWGGIETISGIHTLTDMIKPEKYFKDHPEYFALVDGKRNPVQLCMTNKDVRRMLIQQSLESEYKHVCLSSRDGPDYCHCPQCTAIIKREDTPAAAQLDLVNYVAAAVERKRPDKRIWFLAYQSTAKPPKKMKPRRNVIVWLCSDSHGFGPETHYLTQTPKFQSYLRGWTELGAKMAVWVYVTNFGTGMHLCPLPNMEVVGEDMRWLSENKNVVGILLEGCLWSRGDRGRMRSWIWAKQSFNPSLDTNELMRDFVYGYYGKAAEPIMQYNDLLRVTWEKWHNGPVPMEKQLGATPPLGKEFTDKASALFDEAERLASDDPVLASRVEDARLPLLFQQLLNGISRAEDHTNPLPADDPYWKIVDRLRDYCTRWQTSLFGQYDALARAEAARKGDDDRSLSRVFDTPLGQVFSQRLPARWRFATDAQKVGMSQNWFARDFDDSKWGWIRTDLDSGWQAQGFSGADSDAFGWYRQTTYIENNTNPWKTYNWYVLFEGVDEDAYVYINGKKAFEHTPDSTGLTPEQIWEVPFIFKATEFLSPGGNNQITVGVYNRKMMGGIWKPVHILACENELDLKTALELVRKK